MIISTKYFGEVDIDEKGIIVFEEGLPGFDDVKKFVILKSAEETPFSWLQNIEGAYPAFTIVNPFELKKDYEIDIDASTEELLEIKDSKDVAVFSIVVIPEDVSKMTANLKAPLIINMSNKKGRQMFVENSTYEIKHYIMEELLKNNHIQSQEAK